MLTFVTLLQATVIAKTPVDLLIIEKDAYNDILKETQQNDMEELVRGTNYGLTC